MGQPAHDLRAPAAQASPPLPLDEQLMRRMQDGDEGALATLYDRHAPVLFTLAVRILGDRALAQDVVQETFLSCWDQAASFDPERGRVAAWLTRCARNRAIDVLRSRPHRARMREQHELPGTGSSIEPAQGDFSDAVLVRHAVRSALASLSPPQRQAIELSYFGGLTQVEIASKLGEPLGTVKTRMRSALENLRQFLGAAAHAPDAARGGAP